MTRPKRSSHFMAESSAHLPKQQTTMSTSESYYDEAEEDEQLSMADYSHRSEDDDMMAESSGRDAEAEIEKENRNEDKQVQGCRFAILVLIVLACALVSGASFYYLREQEKEQQKATYELFLQNIEEIVNIRISTLKEGIQTLSEEITAHALLAKEEFPYVTLPNFEVSARNARRVTRVESVIYVPVVTNEADWIAYSQNNTEWIQRSREALLQDDTITPEVAQKYQTGNLEIQGSIIRVEENEVFNPVWQTSPPPHDPLDVINIDATTAPEQTSELLKHVHDQNGLFGSFMDEDYDKLYHEQYVDNVYEKAYINHPHSTYLHPVRNAIGGDEVVGYVCGFLTWDIFFAQLLPANVQGINAVLGSTCGDFHTYELNEGKAIYEGPGDYHSTSHEGTEFTITVIESDANIRGQCDYFIKFYSSSAFEESLDNSVALPFASALTVVFAVMAISFLLYDMFVRRRNNKVVATAARSDAILSSLFPSNIRDRLVADNNDGGGEILDGEGIPQSRLNNFLTSGEFLDGATSGSMRDVRGKEDVIAFKSKPIADLFPETTIMFADISGFTAWSSVREPSQVFTLLETLYHSFDEIARRRRVFKVETVGDCYVAVTGLPDPQKDHAIIMSRFARDCLIKVRQLTKKLEVVLGPDTGDLAMRIGLHSGPVTAGVLRGERSRFQLFGDTMNTASRMESTGVRDRIQISQETADLLLAAGKMEWIKAREDKVVAKGKGELQTYWLQTAERAADTSSTFQSDEDMAVRMSELDGDVLDAVRTIFDPKTTRLIDWNVDVLIRLLKHIVARRRASTVSVDRTPANEQMFLKRGLPVMDEVKEIIELPSFDAQAAMAQDDPESVMLSDDIIAQLHDYVCNVAAIYRDNAFHSFEHASHVTMSVTKLLSRIVAPSEFDFQQSDIDQNGKQKIASTLHDHTYGITSDPLTQFACVFSALIHDADHTGVPNAQLVKENSRIAEFYKGKSVAEQNSVDLCWDLLMDPTYDELRHTIYTNNSELKRFRQLVVNSVMATDIVDKELKVLRNMRWDRAFSEKANLDVDAVEDRNRKATIVIEHLIQASDVAHTMQHWHIYRKWNERLFLESYEAYKNGRSDKDPAVGWYNGEIGFFDFYIIPLAKKLKDCGVFGVSSDEYLNYAIKNREEWEIRGRDLVDEMLEAIHKPKQSSNGVVTLAEPVVIPAPVQQTDSARPA